MGATNKRYDKPGKRPKQNKPDGKKAWYKKWWVWVLILLVLWLLFGRSGGGKTETAEPVEVETVEVVQSDEVEVVDLGEAPDQVGELLTTARADLELEGFTVEAVSDDGKVVVKEGNWRVVEQKQKDDTVLLTVAKEESSSTKSSSSRADTEACLALAEPLSEANVAMSQVLATEPDDAQAAVDVWRSMGKGFEKFGKKESGSEVGDLSAEVGRDAHRLADAMEKAYVKDDMTALPEYMSATQDFQKSYEELLEVCD